MVNHRLISLLSIAAVVICMALIGFPWSTPPVLANFSGTLVYSTDNGSIQLTGNYTLYGKPVPPSSVRLKIVVGNLERFIEADPTSETFAGLMTFSTPILGEVEAWLEVNGQVISRGKIAFPEPNPSPSIQIIRFSSHT